MYQCLPDWLTRRRELNAIDVSRVVSVILPDRETARLSWTKPEVGEERGPLWLMDSLEN